VSHIVLVEDNPGDVLLIELALKETGIAFEMTQFNTGEDALEGLSLNGIAPDVILLDLNTPGSDGFEVLSRLKSTPHLATVPVAIITSSQASRDQFRSKSLGAIRYIEKPSDLQDFLTTVGRAVKDILNAASMRPAAASAAVHLNVK
jgi:CheY-like chemotaxis protein